MRPEVRWGHRAQASVHPKCERRLLACAPAGIRHAARDSSAWATASLRLLCYCGNASVQVQLVGQANKMSEHRGSSSLRDPALPCVCAETNPLAPLTAADESTSQHLPMVWAQCHSTAAFQLYKHPGCRERSPRQSPSAWNRSVVRFISTVTWSASLLVMLALASTGPRYGLAGMAPLLSSIGNTPAVANAHARRIARTASAHVLSVARSIIMAHSATPTAPGAAAFASSRARCRIAKWLPGISNAPNVQSMPGSHALHFLRRPPTKPALTHAATQLQQRHLTLLSATQHFPVSRQDPAPLSCCLASRTLQVAQRPRNRCTTVFARCVC